MRVLFIEPCFPNFGGYFRAYNICQHLSLHHIKVDLLVSSSAKFLPKIIKTKINPNFTQYQLPRIYLGFYINGRILRGLIATIFGLCRHYDIIHAAVPTQLESNIPAIILKLAGKTVVVDWDDLWADSPFNGIIIQHYINFCESKFLKYIGNIVTVSEFLSSLAIKRGATHTLTLINGVDSSQFPRYSMSSAFRLLHLDSSYSYLLSFGNSYIGDRAFLLFKTFEHLLQQKPKSRLIINFDPTPYIDLYGLYQKIDPNVFKSVIVVGNIPQEKIGLYLAVAKIAIFPMGQNLNEIACFPIRIGSYLLGHRPIATTNSHSQVATSLRPFKCLVIAPTPRRLAQKIVNLLDNPQKLKTLQRHTALASQQLSWEHLILLLIDYYQLINDQNR